MAGELEGQKIAILAADGVEQVELEEPRKAVEGAGAEVELLSIQSDEIQAMNGDIDKGDTFAVDREVSDASVDDYDGLILPGGTMNPDNLRTDESAVRFVQDFFKTGKPVGSICHGPWIFVEADVARGRKVTSYPSIRTDLRNAGAEVLDEEVVVDEGLVTSRNPDDLEAFCAKLVEEFAEGEHPVHDEGATAGAASS
jgi:protease I